MTLLTAANFQPLESNAPVIVYIDYKSPYAFVAKDHTYALADALGVAFDWRPITLDIPSYLGSARLDNKGKVASSNRTASQWSGVKYAYADARRYAARLGYTLRGTEKIWDTRLVHIAMLWAKQAGDAALRRFTDAAYPPFWRRDLDVEDPVVVAQLLAACDINTAGFDDYLAGPGGELHDVMQQQVFATGIFGVPTYVVTATGDWFFGREHLPMVEWLARESLGLPQTATSPPDIGNPTSMPPALALQNQPSAPANSGSARP